MLLTVVFMVSAVGVALHRVAATRHVLASYRTIRWLLYEAVAGGSFASVAMLSSDLIAERSAATVALTFLATGGASFGYARTPVRRAVNARIREDLERWQIDVLLELGDYLASEHDRLGEFIKEFVYVYGANIGSRDLLRKRINDELRQRPGETDSDATIRMVCYLGRSEGSPVHAADALASAEAVGAFEPVLLIASRVGFRPPRSWRVKVALHG